MTTKHFDAVEQKMQVELHATPGQPAANSSKDTPLDSTAEQPQPGVAVPAETASPEP